MSGDRTDAIVVGASAGAIQALSRILPALPADYPIPVLVVVHIPADRSDLLAPLFQTKCRLVVKEAEDKEPIQPGTVYFAPPDYHLLIDRGPAFALSTDEAVHFSRPSIDVLFDSAADIYGERLIGVILTGANQDGAEGLAAIGRAGGRTVVQDPVSAAVAYLPEAALKQGPVDLVLSLPQLRDLFASWGTGG